MKRSVPAIREEHVAGKIKIKKGTMAEDDAKFWQSLRDEICESVIVYTSEDSLGHFTR